VSDRRQAKGEEPDLPTKRELQKPVDDQGTWTSPEEEGSDPQREEAAERAKQAVKPGRPRE
jgi:hypothetical protein